MTMTRKNDDITHINNVSPHPPHKPYAYNDNYFMRIYFKKRYTCFGIGRLSVLVSVLENNNFYHKRVNIICLL